MLTIHSPKEELIHAMDESLIESILYEKKHTGNDLIELNDLIIMNTGIHSADMNGIFQRQSNKNDIIQNLKQAFNYFKKKKIPYYWWVGKHRNSNLREILEEFGYEHVADLPVMIADLEKLPAPIKMENIQCKTVQTLEELDAWSKISSVCLEMTPEAEVEYNNYCFHHNLTDTKMQELYLVYWNGIPAASCMTFKGIDIATLYFIATLPEYRNRGLGRSITLHAMHMAKEEGYTLAGLQATSMGMSLYENLGFTTISTEFIYAKV